MTMGTRLFTWLRESYPEMFEVSDAEDRHWLFRAAFALRCLITWPPHGPEEELDRWHPVRQLRSLVNNRASILV